MSGNVLKYKGYSTVIEYSAEDQVLHGKIEGIRDLVDFCSESAAEIEKEFHAAVDSYLAFCAEIGKEPDKEYSGTFNVRIKPELHKQIAIRAVHEGWSLNTAVENAIEYYLKMEEQEIRQDSIPENTSQVTAENGIAKITVFPGSSATDKSYTWPTPINY